MSPKAVALRDIGMWVQISSVERKKMWPWNKSWEIFKLKSQNSQKCSSPSKTNTLKKVSGPMQAEKFM